MEQGKRLKKKMMNGETTEKKVPVEETQDKKESKEVIVKEEAGLPSVINFEEDMAGGFENVTSKDFRIPILRVLQSGSPEVDEENSKYIEGAKPGSLFNISTKEIFSSKEGIWLVPCGYHKKWVEFIPRDKGGGYVDEYPINDPIAKKAKKADKGTNKIIAETGNTLTETGYFPCIAVFEDGRTDNVVLTISSSAWNFAKNWLDILRKKVIMKDGRPLPKPPAFWSYMYRIGSHSVKNPQYTWKQFMIIEDRKLTNDDVQLYLDAKELNRISNSLDFGSDQSQDDSYENPYNQEVDDDENSAY